MADLASIKPASEIIVDIKHPITGALIGVQVMLMSIHDERMKALKRNIADRRLTLERKGKSFKYEDLEENGHEIAFRAMTGWVWDKDADGEPATWHGKVPEFNKPNVTGVFREFDWFHEQIMEAISEDKRFFTN